MTELFDQHGTANGTGLIVEAVSLRTGLVAKLCDLAVDVGITATRAGVGGITLFRTSGSGDHSIVIVTQLLNENSTANGTSLIVKTIGLRTRLVAKLCYFAVDIGVNTTRTGVGGITLFGTGGRGDNGQIIMAEFFGQDCTANGTSLIVQTICLGTGLMAKLCDLAVGVSIITTRASVGGVALLGTGGSGDNRVVIMTNGIRAASVLNSFLANHTEFGIYTFSLAGRRDILCPIGQLMSALRRLNSRCAAAARRGFLGGLNMLTLCTFIVENIVPLIAKEHIQDLLDKDLQPPLGSGLLLVVMRRHGCLFNRTVTAILANEQDLAMLRASGALGHAADVLVTVGGNDLGILVTAYGTSVANFSVFDTSRFGFDRTISVSVGFFVVSRVPLATNRTDVLVVPLFGAGGRDPDRSGIVMTVAVMNTIQHKYVIAADRHALGVSDPAVCGIAHLFPDLGRHNDRAIRQDHLGNKGHAVGIEESHGILAGAGLDDGSCHDIHRGSSGDSVGLSVAIDVPADQHLRFLRSLGQLQIGLANDLRGQEYLAAHEVAVLIVEVRRDPLVAVDHLVAVAPAGEVFIPTHVLLVGFNVNGNAGDVAESIKPHFNVFPKNNGFQGKRDGTGGRTEIPVNIVRWHFSDHKSFEVGQRRKQI